jgi:CO dehydrogenase/acetyl-CoA synthase alpha subunit
MAAGEAPQTLIEERQRVLDELKRTRMTARQRRTEKLPADLPRTVEELVSWLENCASGLKGRACQECLVACTVYAGEMALAREGATTRLASVRRWLESCAACGMCEEACPRGFPMAAVIRRVLGEANSLAVGNRNPGQTLQEELTPT